MNLRCLMIKKNNRRGSYLVEAAMIIPLFFIAFFTMISIIPKIAVYENITFSTVEEMRFECIKSAFRENSTAMPLKTTGRVLRENPKLDYSFVTDYKYLYSENNMNNLISIQLKSGFDNKNPFGIGKKIYFSETVTARAFTGAYYHGNTVTADDEFVFVFPEWGETYHNGRCTYVKRSGKLEYLSGEIKKDYKPCKLCNASSAQLGSPVFCFAEYGEVYHMPDCSVVDRYYVEIRKTEAEAKGYRPCSKCGG